jgi:hypothetical protein
MKFEPTQAEIEAAENVFLRKAFIETIKPVVEGYRTAILAEKRFTVKESYRERAKSEVILDPNYAFMMEKEDFTTYLALVNEARIKANLFAPTPDHCPLSIAEGALVDAEIVLVNELSKRPDLETLQKAMTSIKTRQKVIESSLQLLSPFVRNAEAILRSA